MADDFYPFVDSGDPAPDNSHITGTVDHASHADDENLPTPPAGDVASFATRISIHDDMISTPRVIVIEAGPVRAYLEEVTNTVYRCMKEQGGNIPLMVIREIVENFIHAHFVEPVISILDGGNTIRFADQGPGINDKERAFEFGVTSANRAMKRYIRGTGAGFPMVQEYLEAAGGGISIEDNLGAGTVVTVSIDHARVEQIKQSSRRGAAVRSSSFDTSAPTGTNGALSAPTMGGGPTASQPSAAWNPNTAWPPTYQTPQGYEGFPGYPGTPGYQGFPAYQGYLGYQSYQAQPPYPTSPIPQAEYAAPTTPYSTMPQGAPHGEGAYPQGFIPEGGDRASREVFVSERGHLALQFLREHGHCGPTELAGAYGQSNPTWSRELGTLSKSGFVVKQGQKYYLTDLGRTWIDAR